ncbi:MAG TPA: hypothetical protein VEN82_09165 [Actinomycetota bacterium]|nr:hypothetical protein [Actinomycetota bacterium]
MCDGSRWAVFQAPSPAASAQLDDVAVAGTDAWGVGGATGLGGAKTLIESYC